MKQCTTCSETKIFDEFYIDLNQSSGFRPNCKECCRKVNKINKSKNKEREYEWLKKERERRKFDLDYRFIHARSKAKNKGKSRGYSWSIGFEDYSILMMKGCHYCSSDLLTETGIGLDRIDNSLGYTLANVLPCCGDCNKIKQDKLTVEEMEVAMSAIIKYRKNLANIA